MAKPLKKRGALLKLAGTVVIFVSFVTQNFFYESWRQSADALTAAQSARSLIDKGALINEAMYYILVSPSMASVIPEQQLAAQIKVKQYALKIHQSEVINIASLSSLSKEEKTTYINALHAKLATVNDLPSAAAFTDFLNEQATKYSGYYRQEVEALSEKRTAAKWFYLVMYAVGALLLLSGLYFDWKGAEE